jgi:quercetin dioxygenase-like cupin family protein
VFYLYFVISRQLSTGILEVAIFPFELENRKTRDQGSRERTNGSAASLLCAAMATGVNTPVNDNEWIAFRLTEVLMKVIHLADAEQYEPEKGWLRASTCSEKNISLEYFVKPPKHSSPLHVHSQEQVCIVIKGRMKVRNDQREESILEVGDAAYFSSNEPHGIENLLDEESIGVDIFVPGRSFDFWLKRKRAKK